MKRTILGLSTSLLQTLGTASAKNQMVGGQAMFEKKNIVQKAIHPADYGTLVAALKAAGLVDTVVMPN